MVIPSADDTYCIKYHYPSRWEIYNRNYRLIATLHHQSEVDVLLHELEGSGKRVVDTWRGWTGGASNLPGDATWYERAAFTT